MTNDNIVHNTLYRSPADSCPSWEIYCWRSPIGRLLLVRFLKYSKQRKCLDQVALWHDNQEWDPHRWVPRPPTVPREVIEVVKNKLLIVEAA